jgi:hypothetical protein
MALLPVRRMRLAQLLRRHTVAESRTVRIPDTSLRTRAKRVVPPGVSVTSLECAVLVEVAMIVRCRYSFGVLVLSLCSLATHTFAQATSEVPPKDIRVPLLGTASGPRAFVDKAGSVRVRHSHAARCGRELLPRGHQDVGPRHQTRQGLREEWRDGHRISSNASSTSFGARRRLPVVRPVQLIRLLW